MYCSNCRAEIPDEALFCHKCGSALTSSSPRRQKVEVCDIYLTGEKPGCLVEILTMIPFSSFSVPTWYEARMGGEVFAKSESFTGHYRMVGDATMFMGENPQIRKVFIDRLQLDGWEPVIDPRGFQITTMQRRS